MFSRRTNWSLAPNRLASAIEEKRRSGARILDLTISNPTRAGFEYPLDAIGEALAAGARHPYDPQPKGDAAARKAVAGWYAARGLMVDPARIVLTASTSEAYAWVFKLLCEPGDHVLVPRPSYPLFEFLAALESVRTLGYLLRYETFWEIDFGALERTVEDGCQRRPDAQAEATTSTSDGAAHRTGMEPGRPKTSHEGGRARAIVVVNPNNPTGSLLAESELGRLGALARRHDLALICDEVFSTYALDGPLEPTRLLDPGGGDLPSQDPVRPGERVRSLLGRDETPAFVLDGLSKSAGLPGVKAGWIVVLGPPSFRDASFERLEIIADTYLSVGSPVLKALPRLIEIGAFVNRQILARIRANHAVLRGALAGGSACEALRAEGGWSAILRVPRTLSEEDWCLRLLGEDRVLVQPGWFFDFESEAYLVLSLLTPEDEFREGLARILARAG